MYKAKRLLLHHHGSKPGSVYQECGDLHCHRPEHYAELHRDRSDRKIPATSRGSHGAVRLFLAALRSSRRVHGIAHQRRRVRERNTRRVPRDLLGRDPAVLRCVVQFQLSPQPLLVDGNQDGRPLAPVPIRATLQSQTLLRRHRLCLARGSADCRRKCSHIRSLELGHVHLR